ncbi:MAG: M48 family metallopeptidase [Rhodobacteraceae bacterium]|nr:M48 family metallopeptidase [Paracoccaceae bacterium]
MLRLTPLLLALLYGLVLWHFSAWRLRRELDARSVPLADPALQGVLGRLAAAIGVERVPVHLYEVDAVNGLAAPDGRIFLTRGFYRKFREGEVTADELASVIAHELGHVALGHSRRRMIDFSGQNAVRIVLATFLGRFLPGIGTWLAGLAAALLAARLSRQDEFEADEYASALLIKAGIGTGPQKSLFAKLDRLTGAAGRTPPAWLTSHPRAAERIAAIAANEARWTGAPRRPD